MKNKSYEVSELIKARDEGRLLVLPAPVGGTVYMVVSKSKALFDCTEESWFAYVKKTAVKSSNLLRVVEEYGHTIFSSKEEAEAVANRINGDALAGKYQHESLIKQRGGK